MNNNDMHLDTSELRNRIIREYGSIEAFAEVAKMNPSTLARHLNGTTVFRIEDTNKISKTLGLSINEIRYYFFTPVAEKVGKISLLLDVMTDSEIELLRQIMSATDGRPNLQKFAKIYTGRTEDLQAALAQI